MESGTKLVERKLVFYNNDQPFTCTERPYQTALHIWNQMLN